MCWNKYIDKRVSQKLKPCLTVMCTYFLRMLNISVAYEKKIGKKRDRYVLIGIY